MRFLIALLALLVLVGCSHVPSGYVGIKVYKLGGAKGVDHEVLGTGRYWIGMNEDLYLFPLFKQTYPFTKAKDEGSSTDESFNFQTVEGLSVNCDVGVTVHIERDKASDIFQTYRKGIDEIIHEFLRNEIRNAFNNAGSKYKVDYVYGEGKSKLLKEVEKAVQDKMASQGIIVESLYLLGDMRLPDAVVQALNSKIAAIQQSEKSEYELRQAQAEAKKTIAKAEGEAKANQVRMSTINESLIKYEQILNERAAITKWNGVLPLYTAGQPFITFSGKGE